MGRLLPLFLLLAGCAAPPARTQLSVVATFYPLYEFTRAIGADGLNVRQLVPPGVSPHDYEPTPSDAAAIGHARVFVYNGAGLERWAHRLTDSLPPDAVRVEATRGLPLVKWKREDRDHLAEHKETDRDGSPNHGHEEESVDPHTWLDPVLAQQMVDNIAAGLAQANPSASAAYRERAQALKQRLQALHTRYAETLVRCRSRLFITSHAAFGYLARRYQLRMESVLGLAHEADPSPRRLRELVELARREKVQAVFAETLAGRSAVQALSHELGVRLLVLDPAEGLRESDVRAGKNYFTVMEENLRQLALGLGCL